MKPATVKNFHLPLPEPLYLRLKEAASKRQVPATQLAKQAVEYWLQEHERLALHEEIEQYVAAAAGTEADLDEELEAAALEHLAAEEQAK